mmetsp:Transcript_25094/g.47165  ORF Transcript_25094/g.47165 Transcript_25094/m.47165 type:complete len:293 (-) Transcript_25094:197-1075(-)
MLGLRKDVPPVVGVVGLLELVSHGVADELRHGEPVKVEVRVFNLLHLEHVGVVKPPHNIHVVVILKGEGPAIVTLELMVGELNKVHGVEDDRRDRDHPFGVNRSHEPSSPSPLASPRNNIVVELAAKVSVSRAHVLSQSVHRPQDTLDHGQADQPLRLIGLVEEVVPRIGDDGVLSPALLFGILGEEDVLIGHLKEGARDSSGADAQGGSNPYVLVSRRGVTVRVAPTCDVHGGVALPVHIARDDDHEVVPPDTPIDVFRSQPLLGSHVQEVSRPGHTTRRGPIDLIVKICP